MPKKPSPNRIKKHLVYSIWEAAEALRVHRQTVISWIKDKGLIADTSIKPWLIKGADLKTFLGERRSAGKCKLALHQMYCLPCRIPQTPDGRVADYQQRTRQTGNLMGLCPDCGRVLNKAIRRADLEAIRVKLDVTVKQADPTLVSPSTPPVTATINIQGKQHVKAQ